MLRFGQAQPVPVIPWGPRGSDTSVRGIAEALKDNPGTSAVLLANHGLLVFGSDPLSTARLVVAIEESTEAELEATALGGAVDFPPGRSGRRARIHGRNAALNQDPGEEARPTQEPKLLPLRERSSFVSGPASSGQ
ncbi:class II aldolase/adducin family protein [Arthrobacter sp. TMP15]|uniref:class II aldolase/adducin family protein n=1 Tax=Arthrobacter sp. TMP15 TaxID=3140789 RepID=UPI0031BB8AE2